MFTILLQNFVRHAGKENIYECMLNRGSCNHLVKYYGIILIIRKLLIKLMEEAVLP